MTWTKIDTIHPVTVGAEVVIIDRERNLTSTSTEIITTAIVVDMGGRETTLDPSLWNNNGTFEISNVPTKTTTQIDHWGTVHTMFVSLHAKALDYSSLTILENNRQHTLIWRRN
ncbi:uncharacterized protein RHO25_011049 [Cercospora beticola]|uniref:Uncharacterized protein n=1 Tax=Cercospora beticola TaxID=122368 RepID=A0ABZ0P3Y3_CERBT|nr:hypothetical protein RHO25_011049 [Cercospora beticola]